MKHLLGVLLCFLLLTGCNTVNFEVSVTKTPFFKSDVESPFILEVDKDGKAAKGLEIEGKLEMVKMDHGEVPVTFEEKEAGVYESTVSLPMEGEWECALIIEDGSATSEEVIMLKVEKQDAVAKLGSSMIGQEELAFYELLSRLQHADADRNTLLTHMIRSKSMALLAKEKGLAVSDDEVEEKLMNLKSSYQSMQEQIAVFGKERFWEMEEERVEEALLADAVLQDLYEKEKKSSPKAGEQEWQYSAKKNYEELLQSQVSSLQVEIY